MPITEISFKDQNGFHYKHPERSCDRCKNYPCIEGMKENLLCNFARYGCRNWDDVNTFNICKPKK